MKQNGQNVTKEQLEDRLREFSSTLLESFDARLKTVVGGFLNGEGKQNIEAAVDAALEDVGFETDESDPVYKKLEELNQRIEKLEQLVAAKGSEPVEGEQAPKPEQRSVSKMKRVKRK